MTETAALPAPFRRPGTISRRSVLAGMLGIGVAGFLDTSFTTRPALAAPPKPLAELPLPNRLPYSITASSELADDVFATNEITIGDGDRLLPFYNPFSQTVEALVFTAAAQSVHHLHRDPTQASGWAYEDFDLQGALSSVDDVAVAADGKHVYAILTGDPGPDGGGSTYWVTWLDDATGWDFGSTDPGIFGDDLPDGSSPLKGGISSENVPYFYTTSNSGTTATVQGWVVTFDDAEPVAPMTDSSSVVLTLDTSATEPVSDCVVLYDTNGSGTTTGYAIVLYDSGALVVYPQQGEVFSTQSLTDSGTSGVSQVLYAWATPGSQTGVPGYAIQANIPATGYGEGTYFCDEQGNVVKVNDSVAPGDAAASVWLSDDQYTVNLLDANYVLQTIQQTGPGTFADPLPVTNGVPGSPTPGLTAVYSVPTDPTRNTLFGIGADSSLSVLSLDDSGWTQTQLHQSYNVGVPVDSYRLTIKVVDTHGAAVGLASAQLSTDRPVGLWQDIGSTSLVPGTPVTLQADLQGRINVSVPAEEMDVAVLTVQALDPTGQPSGPAVPVSAAYDVQSFLGGTGSLSNLGTISATTLQAAKNADGTDLLPGLDSGSASSLVTHLASAVTAGKGGPPAANAYRAVRLVRKGKKLVVSTSRDPKAFGIPERTEVSLSISHLFHTIGHAIRHAVDKIASATVRWAADLGTWVVDLATDLTALATYAINDIKDAFHVIGGWFATLGADIKAAVAWLKREIFGFLSSVGDNATVIEGLISQAPAALVGLVGGIEKQVDGWFSQVEQQNAVTGWFTELANLTSGTTAGSSQPPASDPSDTGSSTAMSSLGKDIRYITEVIQDSPGMWLYDKLTEHLPADPGPDLSGVFDKVYADLVNDFTGFTDLGKEVVQTIWAAFQAFSNPSDLNAAKLSDVLNDLGQVVVDVLKLCDAIFDTVLDFVIAALNALADYLAYKWNLTSIDPILEFVLDKLGISITISLNRLVSLVLALPVTLVRTIRGQAPAIPTSLSKNKVVLGGDQIDELFYTMATISQVVWTFVDVVGDLETVAEQGDTERPQQEGIIDYFDILCPIAQTVFLLPGWNNQLIWDGLPDGLQLKGLIAPAVLGSVATPAFKIAQKVSSLIPNAPKDPDTVQYYDEAPAKPNPLAQYYGPVVSMIGGLANTVMGSMVSERNSDTTATKIEGVLGTVLGDLSNVLSPLTTWWLNDSLEDLPVAVKIGIDGVGGAGAAIVYAINAYED